MAENECHPEKKNEEKKTSDDIMFNEKSCLNSDFKEKSTTGTETHPSRKYSIKSKSVKNPERNDNAEFPVFLSDLIKNDNSNSVETTVTMVKVNSPSLEKEESKVQKQSANEFVTVEDKIVEEAPIQLIDNDEDDEFFILNEDIRDKYLSIKNEIEKYSCIKETVIDDVDKKLELDEDDNRPKNIIILNGEKPIVTTFSYFNADAIIHNQNNNEQDQFESMRITYV